MKKNVVGLTIAAVMSVVVVSGFGSSIYAQLDSVQPSLAAVQQVQNSLTMAKEAKGKTVPITRHEYKWLSAKKTSDISAWLRNPNLSTQEVQGSPSCCELKYEGGSYFLIDNSTSNQKQNNIGSQMSNQKKVADGVIGWFEKNEHASSTP